MRYARYPITNGSDAKLVRRDICRTSGHRWSDSYFVMILPVPYPSSEVFTRWQRVLAIKQVADNLNQNEQHIVSI